MSPKSDLFKRSGRPCHTQKWITFTTGVSGELYFASLFTKSGTAGSLSRTILSMVRHRLMGHGRGFAITLRHTTLGRNPLNEWSAGRRDLFLTSNNIHKRKTSIPPAGLEPAIPASEGPQTHALDRAATGTGYLHNYGKISTVSTKTTGLFVLRRVHRRLS